jgi:hypothetical protein
VSEPFGGSEDQRSEDRDDVLFGRRTAGPDPAPPPQPDPTPDPSAVARAEPLLPPQPPQLPELADQVGAIDRRTAALQARLEEVARALGLLGRRLQEPAQSAPEFSAVPAAAPAIDDARLQAIEDRLRHLPASSDLARMLDEAVSRATDPLTGRLDALAAHQERELALIDGLSAALDAEGASLRMDQERVVAMLATLRDDLADADSERSGVTSTAAWSDVVNRVERAMTAQANRIEAVLGTVRQTVEEQLGRQQDELTGLTNQVVDEVARVREVTADRLHVATVAGEQAASQVTSQLASAEAAIADHLDGLRGTMTAVTGPLAALEQRTDDLANAVASSAGALAASQDRLEGVDASMRAVTEAMQEFGDVVEQRIGEAAATALASSAAELSTARQAVEASGERAADALRRALDDVSAALDQAIRDASTAAAERAGQTLDEASERLGAATVDATATAARLEAFEDVLAAVLVEHDQALADQRAQLVYDLVSSLAGNLTKRERKRLADKLEIPPTPQTADMSRRLREVFDLAANRDLSGLPRQAEPDQPEPPADLVVSTESAQVEGGPPLPKRVLRSALADIIDDDLEDLDDHDDLEPPIGPDPDLDEVLGGIRGLPDATRRRLLAAFGSVAELDAADDEAVLQVKGVGPGLLARLRALD